MAAKATSYPDHGVGVNGADLLGQTGLMLAAMHSEGQNLAGLLLAHGADPAIRDNSGYAALDHAFRCQNREMASLLNFHTSPENSGCDTLRLR